MSARPSLEEMQGVPHKLFGHIDGAQAHSAAIWAHEARQQIDLALLDNRLPILVGGTGLYIRTLIDGIAPVPDIDPAIRAEVRSLDARALYAALCKDDAEAATRLNRGDTTRLARALEVVRSTGRSLSSWQTSRVGGIVDAFRIIPIILLPDRDWLLARCDARFVDMIAGGAIEEVTALMARNLAPDLPVMRAIGVRDIAAYIKGDMSREGALCAGQLATRQYAKRQYTWFRNQPPQGWGRHEGKFSSDSINDLAIKLCSMALTA